MSRSATCFASLLCVLLGARAAAEVPGARAGGRVSDEHARAGDAVVSAVFPGATRDWNDGRLIWPDGRREKLELSGLTRLRVGDTWWVAAGVDFPERVERELKRLETLRAPAEAVRGRVVVVRCGADFSVEAWRAFDADTEAMLSRVHAVEFVLPVDAGRWPRLRVSASSASLIGDAAMTVAWLGLLDAEAQAWVSRAPRAYQERRAGGQVKEDALEPRADNGRLRFYGVASGEPLGPACVEPCKRRPLALFDRMP